MDVTLAQMTASLTASPAQQMPDASIDAETTRLAMQAQSGDAEAFCALVDLHQRAARRVAAAALGHPAEVDDAVQDACITAWQQIGRLQDPSAFRSWLLRITWRKAIDRRRSIRVWIKRFHHALARSDGEHPHADITATLTDTGIAADERVLSIERDRIVAQVIQSLPVRLRDAFLLASSGEHRYEDIAVLLRIPVGTVKWRVSEARRLLRSKLRRLGL